MLGFDRRDLRPALNLLSLTLRDRYLGSRLGMLWAILNPLLLILVFVLLFGYMLKMRMPGAETTHGYARWLIAGYGPWIAGTEALMTAASSVLGAAALVKNIAFKTELLPVAAVLSSIVTLAVSFVVLILLLLLDQSLTWHALFIVPVFLVHYLMLIGAGLFLAALTVFFRDLVHVLPNLFMVLLLTSPILYPLQNMPALLQMVNRANPFFIISQAYRDALVQHRAPDFAALLLVAAASAMLLIFALRVFRRAKGYFEAYL